VQDDREIDRFMFGDVFFNAPEQLLQHIRAHQFGLAVNGGVAKPIAIRAVNVASRRNLDQQLRNRLACKGSRTCHVSRHADTNGLDGPQLKLVAAAKSTAESAIRPMIAPAESSVPGPADKAAPEIGLGDERLV